MTPYSGTARQVLDADVILVTLDGITYLTTVDAAEYAIDENTHAKLLQKYNGRLVSAGLLFPAKTGRTMYAHVGHSRYRMAMSQFQQVCLSAGHQAPAIYCLPSEVMV